MERAQMIRTSPGDQGSTLLTVAHGTVSNPCAVQVRRSVRPWSPRAPSASRTRFTLQQFTSHPDAKTVFLFLLSDDRILYQKKKKNMSL